MKKLVGILAGILAVMLIAFCGCSSNKIPERPEDTNLEFWVAEDVTDLGYEWEGHYREFFGGAESYWGTGYEPEIDEYGATMAPEHCVFYIPKTIQDGSTTRRIIWAISITDPKVTVYGLTVDSTFEEFDEVFCNMGYKIKTKSNNHSTNPRISHIAIAKGISFELCVYTEISAKLLQIVADVS